ncbi:hypothetical protein Poly59_04470 [Rubripirellula reticaptiva]|uniref:Uncharacterized protein n=1 Tax=Rubripirellula reticaptiva TaxID=2528013 RepID=A0A5C6FAI5_9BACT|nr:hypothetical protein Poly59_04470 [Rubripirellula reticaptiva]
MGWGIREPLSYPIEQIEKLLWQPVLNPSCFESYDQLHSASHGQDFVLARVYELACQVWSRV